MYSQFLCQMRQVTTKQEETNILYLWKTARDIM